MEVLNTFRRATRNAVRARERENGDLNKQAAAATKPSNSFRTALSGIVNSSSTQQKSTSAVKKCKKSTKTKKRGHRVSFDGVEHCEFDSESPAKRRLIGAGVDCVGTVDDLDDEQLAIELHASGLDADGLDRDEMITELNSIQRQNLAEKLSRWVTSCSGTGLLINRAGAGHVGRLEVRAAVDTPANAEAEAHGATTTESCIGIG